MKRNNLLLLFFINVVYFSSVAQQDFTLNRLQTALTGSGHFPDKGGENGEISPGQLQATIKAPTGYIHAFAIGISSGGVLRFCRMRTNIH
jgi:hypothetical protein